MANSKIKTIIVDDEPDAIDLLKNLLKDFPEIDIITTANSAFSAYKAVLEHQPDLLFLDIQMPDLSGMQMYQSLSTKPQVIFTTAYSDYAIEGFEVDATDYLLKPFSYERFMKAVVKAYDNYKKINIKEGSIRSQNTPEFLFVKDGTKTVKIHLKDVLFMEGMKDYIRIHTKINSIMTLMSMQTMLDKLDSSLFVRVHR